MPQKSGKKYKILIVEDEPSISMAFKLKLSSAGYDVKTVSDGEAAIKTLEKDKFDIVFLDLMIPKKDGFAVLGEMKKKNIKTEIIAFSNLAQEEDKTRAKELGARDYFVKSDISIADVIAYVKKYISKN
jgi:two-component system alkaline phosphatase synthesis response regulator PhoP